MSKREVVVIDGARTPFGSFGGAFKDVSAIDLAVYSAKEAIARSNVDADEIDEVVMVTCSSRVRMPTFWRAT